MIFPPVTSNSCSIYPCRLLLLFQIYHHNKRRNGKTADLHYRLIRQSIFSTINGLEVNAMKIKEDIKPVSYLKSRSAELLAQINETRRPVIITQNGEPKAVIQDAESYEKMVSKCFL